MRLYAFVFLFAASACLAQETYHNEEYGFTIDIPSQWYSTDEDEWSDILKAKLKRSFSTKTLLLLNPSGVEPPKTPHIQIQGKELKKSTTSEAIAALKKNDGKGVVSAAKWTALRKIGKVIEQYDKIDSFYDYDSSRKLAIAKVLYKHKESGTFFIGAIAKRIGRQRVVDIRGYWKGDDPKEFWQVFTEVVDSFEFDPDAKPKGTIGAIAQEIKETGNLSAEKKFDRIWKWGGIILTISIILGFAKMIIRR